VTELEFRSRQSAREEFARLASMWTSLFKTQDEEEVLERIVEGVRLIGLDRVRVYFQSPDRTSWIGMRHLGMHASFAGHTWPVKRPFDEELSRAHLFQKGVANIPSLSSAEQNLNEWIWVPFLSDDDVVGGLSADNALSKQPIEPETLEFLESFGLHAFAAIQAARSIAGTRKLNALLQVSARMQKLLNLSQVLEATCRSALRFVSVGHCGFVRFDASGDGGTVEAEYPDMGMVGHVVPLRDIPAWIDFMKSRRPFISRDVANDSSLGLSRDILIAKDIRSVMIVPVVTEHGVLGSFGLDSVGEVHDFTKAELETCQSFAEQVAVAITNAERFDETKQDVEQLAKLQDSMIAMASPVSRNDLLQTIIQQAVGLLKAKSSGIYQYYPETNELTVIIDYNRQDQVGKSLKVGEGMAGQLVESGAPYLIVNDYNEWEGRAKIYADKRIFGSVLAVPLKRAGKVLGVLYIDDEVGRIFTERDARLLGLFADQAAIALSDAISKDDGTLKRLQMLSRATESIISRLPGKRLDELLSLIAQRTTEVLDAEACGVFLVKQEAFLTLEASFGHAEGQFQKGKSLPITKDPKSGLTGFIAYTGKIFRLAGRALGNNPHVRGEGPHHTASQKCYSLLAIPLKRKIGDREKLIGLLRIDNKKDQEGRISPNSKFTREDEWILSIFAETVVLSLERTEFIEQLRKEQESLKRFLDSSPTGVIAVDNRGNITGFNNRAEEILGYAASDVMLTAVDRLYYEENEAHRIGKDLREGGERLKNYNTYVRSSVGEPIAIKLSATLLYDDDGNRIGSVGYFDRTVSELQSFVFQARQPTAAQDQIDDLQRLAKTIIAIVPHTFCRILLRGEAERYLIVEAAHSILGEENWTPRLTESIVLSEWPGLEKLLKQGNPRIIRWSKKGSQPNLERLSRSLGLSSNLQTLLLIPLRFDDIDVGLLEIGELRSERRSRFTDSQIDLILKAANQSRRLIAMSLYRVANRHKEELERLHEAAKVMAQPVDDFNAALQLIVNQAALTFDADSASLWSYDEKQNRFSHDDPVAFGIPAKEFLLFRRKQPREQGVAHTVLERGWIKVPDILNPDLSYMGPSTRSLLKRIRISSFQGITLKVGKERVGVLYLNYKKARSFRETDHRALENFAAYAALSLKRAKLASRLQTAQAMSEAATAMTAIGDTDATLTSVVEGTLSAVGCDAIVLYTYDPTTKKLAYPPKYWNVRQPKKAWPPHSQVPTNSFVYRSMEEDDIKVVEQVADEPFFKKSRFARVEGIKSCLVIPLKAADGKVGVMFVNYRTHHIFTQQEIKSVKGFADQAAVAIDNSQLYSLAERRTRVLDGLYKSSHTIIKSLQLKRTLNEVAQQALHIVGVHNIKKSFSHVALLNNDMLDFVAASSRQIMATLNRGMSQINLADQDSSHGIAGLAVQRRGVQNVGYVRQNKQYRTLYKYVQSQLSAPLKIGNDVIGVISVEHPDRDAFTKEDERNLELLAFNAAVAIKNAQQHDVIKTDKERLKTDKERLESLHHAAKAMAAATDLNGALKKIVEKARQMFKADSCALWTYDPIKRRFLRHEPVAIGISPRHFEKFKEAEPKPGRTSHTVLREGWKGVPSLSGPDAKVLGARTVQLLRLIGVRSFQGVALRVADEPIGVLYVNYNEHRTFDDADRGQMENFARYAALTLLRSRLAHEVETYSRSTVAASMTTLQEPDKTLDSLTRGTYETLGCDAVVLYQYDETKKRLAYPPSYCGVVYPEKAWPRGEPPLETVPYRMLSKKNPTIVEVTATHKMFKDRQFVAREHIESCVALPLCVANKKVGVMFVNYRDRHLFDDGELKRIRLFANQAAVAISNLQLYTQSQNQTNALTGLYDAGQTITATLSKPKTLKHICRQALKVIEEGNNRCFSHVATRDGNSLGFIASSSEQILRTLQATSSHVSLRRPPPRSKRRIGIAGRAVLTRRVRNISDVSKNSDYNEIRSWVRSQLSAPLRVGREVVGVLSIEHREIAAFSEQDERNIELLAAQAAVALKNAQQFEELERTKGLVGARTALAWMGMTSSAQGHAIEGHTSNIAHALELLRDELSTEDLTEAQRKLIERRLSLIGRQAKGMARQIAAPHPWSHSGATFPINDFIREWIRQLKQKDFHTPDFNVEFRPGKKNPKVRCSEDWLREVFDILAENAIDATDGLPLRRLLIKTRVENEQIEIAFIDNGEGIHKNILKNLFKERIKKRRTKGLGIGLLMTQAIVQAYDGDIKVLRAGPGNTTMVISLPGQQRKAQK